MSGVDDLINMLYGKMNRSISRLYYSYVQGELSHKAVETLE